MIHLKTTREFITKHSQLFLWLLITSYVLLFSFLSLKKLDNYAYNVFDLGIFNQVFWNTLHGDWFQMTINLNSYLADHFEPFIILLLPLYWLKPGPENLLILQSAVLGLSAWPLYKISQLVLQDKFWSLGIAFVWLVNPFLHNANVFEFHEMPFAVFFIFWAIYFYLRNRFGWFLLFFFLIILVREDVFFILFGFGILAILDKRKWQWWFLPFVVGGAYFFTALKIISHFSMTGSYKFFMYYGWLGGHDLWSIIYLWLVHPLRLLLHIFTFENLFYSLIIILPLLFLPLIRPKYLWLAFLPFVEIILSWHGVVPYVYYSHYILIFYPGVFLALIFAAEKIKQQEIL